MSIVQLEKLLKSTTGGALEDLVKRAEGMDRLLSGLKKALEPALASHLKGVNLRPDGQLVVVAESPAWAARLRFEADKLMAAAQDGGAKVNSCKVIVAKE
jgi:predicted nucleic acid-binding Zn ribbon protein